MNDFWGSSLILVSLQKNRIREDTRNYILDIWESTERSSEEPGVENQWNGLAI